VEEIVMSAYSPYVARIGREPGPMLDDYAALIAEGRVHVLQRQDMIAGLVVLVPQADAMLLDNVAVRPQLHGRGVGKALLTFAEAAARDAGYRLIRLYTHEAMTENIALYSRIGYCETHRAEENSLRRVYMAKPLG
jgi:ribosomal protein S18 acetylase RimI-like enzyme